MSNIGLPLSVKSPVHSRHRADNNDDDENDHVVDNDPLLGKLPNTAAGRSRRRATTSQHQKEEPSEATKTTISTDSEKEKSRRSRRGRFLHYFSKDTIRHTIRQRIPPRYRMAVFILWLLWKVFITFFLFSLAESSYSKASLLSSSTLSSPLRLLYIVTLSHNNNNNNMTTTTATTELLSTVINSIQSLTEPPLENQLDLYLILPDANTLTKQEEQRMRRRLPPGVGLEVWNKATPLRYSESNHQLLSTTWQQPRRDTFVVRDKLLIYDVFLSFDETILLTGQHVQYFVDFSNRLRAAAAAASQSSLLDHHHRYHNQHATTSRLSPGPLTAQQLDRLMPGWMLVHVQERTNETTMKATASGEAQKQPDKVAPDFGVIPPDHHFLLDDSNAGNKINEERHFDPRYCCKRKKGTRPQDVVLAFPETTAAAMNHVNTSIIQDWRVRHLQAGSLSLDWIALLPPFAGESGDQRLAPEERIAGYSWRKNGVGYSDSTFWQDNTLSSPSLSTSSNIPTWMIQQGGWTATREQIIRFNRRCPGIFLPPLKEGPPIDGRTSDRQKRSKVGCNLQRVISLHPDLFSKHWIQQTTSNYEQHQRAQQSKVNVDDVFGQLNTIKKLAAKGSGRPGDIATKE